MPVIELEYPDPHYDSTKVLIIYEDKVVASASDGKNMRPHCIAVSDDFSGIMTVDSSSFSAMF